jgi:hypothetical protein
MYDRCPTCRGPLDFYGLVVRKGQTPDPSTLPFVDFTRWLECRVCVSFVGTNEFGTGVITQKKAPMLPITRG